MIKTVQEQVEEFHEAFGIAICAPVTDKLLILRMSLIDEESIEALDALAKSNMQMIAQELADLVYVVYGTAVSLGIDLDAAIAEVHRSNMSKLGDDGKPMMREDGKVLKGPRYMSPDMKHALRGVPA